MHEQETHLATEAVSEAVQAHVQTPVKNSVATKIKVSNQLSPPSVLSTKIKAASKIAAAAKAAKKRNVVAAVGHREQASYDLAKPPKGKFVRVHPSEEYRMHNIPVLECPDTRDLYFVDENIPGLPDFILEQMRRINVYCARTHDHLIFLWVVKHSDTPWFKAARRAVSTAVNKWVSVRAKNALNTYELTSPFEPIPEPTWNDLPSFDEMLNIAFEERSITHLNHPVIQKLRGIANEDDDDAGLI